MFLMIFFTFAIDLIINSTNLMGQTLVYRNNKTNKTTTTFIYDYKASQINLIAGPLFGIYIPYFLVLCLNIIVILRLRRPKIGVTREENQNILNEFTVSTITVDLVFLIFKAPEALILIFYVCFSLYTSYISLIMEIFTELSNNYSDLLVFIFFFFEASFRKEIIKIFQFFKRFFTNLFS